jgi:hypothetical protein
MDVRVRRLGPEEGLLAAALHVQSLRAAGTAPPGGHLDRFAEVWTLSRDGLPTWVAEVEGRHAGVTMLQVPAVLPPLVGADRGWARLVLLYAVAAAGQEAVTLALVRAAVGWAGQRGLAGVEVGEAAPVPAAVLDALGGRVQERRRTLLPAPR